WKFAASSSTDYFFSPAIGADGTIYVVSFDGALYAVNPDGTQKWAFLTGHQVESSPAIGPDGTIYFGSFCCPFPGEIFAVTPGGTGKWGAPISANGGLFPLAIGANGTIYLASDGGLWAFNPDGITFRWQFPTDEPLTSPPAIGADGTIYVGSNDGTLYAVGP